MDTTSMPRARLMAWIGAALVALGLVVGFMPASAAGVHCGSAFVASGDARSADFRDTLAGNRLRTGVLGGAQAACDDKRSDRQLLVAIALVPGVVLLVAAYALSARRDAARQQQT